MESEQWKMVNADMIKVTSISHLGVETIEVDTGTKLKKCPFCGGDAEVILNIGRANYEVSCARCKTKCPQSSMDIEKALESWNTRYVEQ